MEDLQEYIPEVQDDVVTDWLGEDVEALISLAEALVDIYADN